jgi:uncharacterized protein Usg
LCIRPDRHWLLQTYIWQDYDLFPNFPALKDFLAFWQQELDGPLFARANSAGSQSRIFCSAAPTK